MQDIVTILDQMSLEEQVMLLWGADFLDGGGQCAAGHRLVAVTNGPNGARGGGSLVTGVKSAAFPVGIALGATWDADLVQAIGKVMAEEVKSKGAHVSLAPTCNIQCSVTNGRNFECYSEDPILTANLAVGYIQGLQGEGIAAKTWGIMSSCSKVNGT